MVPTWNSPKENENKKIDNPKDNPLIWDRRKVLEYAGSTSNIWKKIPCFERAPFSTEEAENKYLDIIVRKPLSDVKSKLLPTDDESHIPVAVVSKTYGLIQHQEVFNVLKTALEKIVSNPQSLEAELMITEYGELMRVSFLLHHCDFDPGDGETLCLKVNALNSVDAKTSVNIDLTWYRHSSGTSLMYRIKEKLKKRHVQTLKSEIFERFLNQQLYRLSAEQERYRDWYQTKVSPRQVELWFSETVATRWGPEAAQRAYQIAKEGLDGIEEVPGRFAPAENLYHLSQVLSWIAKWTFEDEPGNSTHQRMLRQRRLETQLKWMVEIPALMDTLLKKEKPSTQVKFSS